MSQPSIVLPVSLSASGYEDGLGRRSLEIDRESGAMLERLHLRPELGAFEAFLRERVAFTTTFDDDRFARVKHIERDRRGTLTIVSQFIAGNRLSDLLEAATGLPAHEATCPSVDAALGFLLEVLPALGSLHESGGHAHGTLAPGRIVLTPASQVVVLDWVFGPAMQRLQFNRRRLWIEFGVATPSTAGPARLDITGDISQASLAAMMMVLGRPLRENEYPDAIGTLVAEVIEIAQIRGSGQFASGLEAFLQRTLPLADRKPHASATEAAAEVRHIAREIGVSRCRTALTAFVEDMNRVLAERVDEEGAVDAIPDAIAAVDHTVNEEPAAEPLPSVLEITELIAVPAFDEFDKSFGADAFEDPPAPVAEGEQPPQPAHRAFLEEIFGPFAAVSNSEDETPSFEEPRAAARSSESDAVVPIESPTTSAAAQRALELPAITATPVVAEPVSKAVPEPVSKPIEPTSAPVVTLALPTAAAESVPAPVHEHSVPQPQEPPTSSVQLVQRNAEPPLREQPASIVVAPAPAPEAPIPDKVTSSIVNPAPAPAAAPTPSPQTTKAQSKRKRRGLKGHRDKLRSNAAPPKPPTPVVPAPPVAIPMPSFNPLPDPHKPTAAPPGPTAPVPIPMPSFNPLSDSLKHGGPTSQPIALRTPEPSKAPAPLRLKSDPPATFSSPPMKAERREQIEVSSTLFRDQQESESGSAFPWKLAAAAIVGVIALIGVGRWYLPSHKTEPEAVEASAAPTPPPAEKIEPLKPGSVAVATQPPGAHVLLDGKAVGDSPITLQGVSPGKHTLTFVTSTGTVKKPIRLEAGKSLAVDVPIYSGWIAVFSPVTLDIAENGKPVGTTEQGRLMLSPGRHQLTFTNEEMGYKTTQAVDIEPGEERSISLVPTGELSANAQPWAEVWMNGAKLGETPLGNTRVPLGTHEIVFKNPKFPDRSVTVTVKASAAAAAFVDFTK